MNGVVKDFSGFEWEILTSLREGYLKMKLADFRRATGERWFPKDVAFTSGKDSRVLDLK